MFNTKYDLLKANWSPFEPVEWLLPLLAENYLLRNTIKDIQKHVYSWSNYSDVLFIADFPGDLFGVETFKISMIITLCYRNAFRKLHRNRSE